ncbi:hypothetical protein MG293_014470 [Ovis ammon polii]|uniref:NADH dehydrogenase [ubiquinone] 1 beta subcomplex subunit 1 n=1 Tax=Ovis ammon polii TaxID=230172 RepID=A0AAD4TZF8_OVIAM|nr:hypothetical protein MG293_014470 [Ovis ammon polii]
MMSRSHPSHGPDAANGGSRGRRFRRREWLRSPLSLVAGSLLVQRLQVVRDHWIHVLVPVGFVFGYYLDRKNDEKLAAFRNKSLLYKRELKPNEEVTWK